MNMADSTAGAPPRPVPVAVFASGGGSNLQAILNHLAGPAGSVARVVLVVSDKADAGALERARRAGVPTRVIPVRDRPGAEVASEMHPPGFDGSLSRLSQLQFRLCNR